MNTTLLHRSSLLLRCARPRRAALLLPLSFPLLLACSSGSGTGSSGGAVGNVVIKDANNYSSTSSLNIPVIPTAAGMDLTITWSGIAKDLLCHTAQSIDNVAFLKIGNMTETDVEQKLAVGQLLSTEVTEYKQFPTAGTSGGAPATSAMLSQFTLGGATTALVPSTDYLASSTIQYLLLFTHGTTIGAGAQAMAFIQPSSTSTVTTVTAPDACNDQVLSFDATLSTMPVSIPVKGPWKVDWSEITKDNFGNTLDFSQTRLDTVELGFYQGMTASDLQAHFLDVQIDATSIWTYSVPLGQKYVDLAGSEADGGAFPGFTETDGTWAVAVLCSTCSIPAPVVFATLTPQ